MFSLPLPSKFKECLSRLTQFAHTLNTDLTPDELMDLAADLYCDEFSDICDVCPDWYVVWWSREEACTGEVFSMLPTQADALGAVYTHAYKEGHDLGPVELEGVELRLIYDGELYARICPVVYEHSSAKSLKRVQTLLSGITVEDEQTLVKRLSEMPAWQMQQYSDHYSWLPDVLPVGTPRAGEWLEPLSMKYGERRSEDSLSQRDPIEQLRARLELNKLPMWVTPQSLAKLLQQELTGRTPLTLKLSQCQEGVAYMFGFKSWNSLVARFSIQDYPQCLMRTVWDDEQTPEVKFFRTPAHLLAWVYDQAERKRFLGEPPLHLSISWLSGDNPSLKFCDRSDADIARQLAQELPSPARFVLFSPEHRASEQNWQAKEAVLREQAREWATLHWGCLGAAIDEDEYARALEELDACRTQGPN